MRGDRHLYIIDRVARGGCSTFSKYLKILFEAGGSSRATSAKSKRFMLVSGASKSWRF